MICFFWNELFDIVDDINFSGEVCVMVFLLMGKYFCFGMDLVVFIDLVFNLGDSIERGC